MKTVTIAGDDYPVKYGRKALMQVMTLAGAKTLKQADRIDQIPPEKWGQMVHFGVLTGCTIQGINPPTLEEVDEAVDLDLSIWSTAIEQLTADLSGGKPVDEGN